MSADGQEKAPGGDTSTQGFISSPELLSPGLGVVSTRAVHHSCYNCPLMRRKHIKMPLLLFLLFLQARIPSFSAKKLLLISFYLMVICFSSYESQILSMGTAQDFGSVSIQSSVEMRDGFLQLCDIFAA